MTPLSVVVDAVSVARSMPDIENKILKSDVEKNSNVIYVDFKPKDPSNPFNFSPSLKWQITVNASTFTVLTAAAGSSIALGTPSMQLQLHASDLQTALAVSVYALGFGIVPLVSASFSEEFGRRPLYLVSSFVCLMMHIGIACAKNIQTVVICRFLAGAAGSTGATMVGGTIADIWTTQQRGIPMSVFALSAVGGTGVGPVVAGWIELNPHMQWRWIQWIHAIAMGLYFLSAIFVMRETRSGVILTRKARMLRKNLRDGRYRARIEDERASLRTLIWISCTRPLYLLFTEPIVASFSIWVAFAWGILYGQLLSIGLVFKSLYGFNQGLIGIMFLPILIGAMLGFVTNILQERLFQKKVAKRGPEARLYAVCLAGILFPIGCFIYAWTSFPHVIWAGPFIGLTVLMFAIFVIYQAVFSYLADCYLLYASSALAGQSLCRNIAATFFPLFSNSMYKRLTFQWASTLLGCIAALMAPIPIILFIYGPKIRLRSSFSQQIECRQLPEVEEEDRSNP